MGPLYLTALLDRWCGTLVRLEKPGSLLLASWRGRKASQLLRGGQLGVLNRSLIRFLLAERLEIGPASLDTWVPSMILATIDSGHMLFSSSFVRCLVRSTEIFAFGTQSEWDLVIVPERTDWRDTHCWLGRIVKTRAETIFARPQPIKLTFLIKEVACIASKPNTEGTQTAMGAVRIVAVVLPLLRLIVALGALGFASTTRSVEHAVAHDLARMILAVFVVRAGTIVAIVVRMNVV
jgi:hypothetical protein